MIAGRATSTAAAIWLTFAADHDRHGVWANDHWASVDAPPTSEAVLTGLTGAGPAISSLFIGPDSYTSVGALDVDRDDGWTSVVTVAQELLQANITTYIEHSRRGGHVRIISAQPMPALLMRRAILAAIQRAGFDPVDPKLEVRPSRDQKTSQFAGGMLRLPWCPHPVTGERYPLLGAGTLQPIRFRDLMRSDWTAIADLAERYVPPPPPPAPPERTGDLDLGSTITDVLERRYGIVAQPGRSIRCPLHQDRHPSASVSRDDRRLWCHAPSCVAHEDGRGVSAWMLERLAP